MFSLWHHFFFSITSSIGEPGFGVTITSTSKSRVRVYMNKLDRKDGLYIVRFRLFENENDLEISVTYKDQHVADSPYQLPGNILVNYKTNITLIWIDFVIKCCSIYVCIKLRNSIIIVILK